jgi:hypothetical protein
MDTLYLDILRIGRSKGKLSFEDLQANLVSKGFVWNEISSQTRKWFDENFEITDSNYFTLKSDSCRWLLDYESNRWRNIGILLLSIFFIILLYLTFKKPQAISRMQIKGFQNSF